MLTTDVPTKFPIPFANSATVGTGVRSVPTNPPAQPGAASLSTGFPPLNFTPVAAGGIPPFGQDMNGILQQVTAWSRWQAAGGPVVYDAAFATSIGGYPRGAVVQSTSGHVFYENLVDGNVTNPNTGGANWRVAFSPWSSQTWTAVGSANAQVLTLSPAPASLAQLIGIPFGFFSQGTNTGPVTLNVNGLGNIQLGQANGVPLGAGALSTGGAYTVVYNGAPGPSAGFLLTSQITTFTDTGGIGATISGVNSASGANLALLGNGGTTPNKFVRAIAGALQVVNSAYSAVIATLTDAGALSIMSSFTSGGPITATASNITAGARLRATLGAFQSSDGNAATILNDFFLLSIPGNDAYALQRLPNGFIIQTYHGITVNGIEFVTFPNAFPNACLQVLVHEGTPSGWTVPGFVSPTIFGTQELSPTSFALYVVRLQTGGATWAFSSGISYRYIALGY